ncbi:MAG: MotA/TolQ/ExbB proton channel family protein [Acidobacteriota bacterium]|nr:MotA/TolQ/ExbB proton channel family protein [Acidobacteriota bacterium]MDH3784551.1 MotA/TolQ/ExbB proton channel family protein [Acidobacteriota bacterium]
MLLGNIVGDLFKYYTDGGNVMHAISILSLASVATIIYKLIAFRRVKINVNNFIAQVRSSLLKGNVKGAIQACEEQRSPVASIVKSGLLKYGMPRVQMEKAMENAAIHEIAYLEKFHTVLATIANIAPLLGFLGTVVGMVLSFEVIAKAGLNNPGEVAKGISQALLTTAYGLIVAFVTQPFYNYFTSKVSAYTRQIETAANIMFETLDELERRDS